MLILLIATSGVALGALVNSLLLYAQNDHLRARLDALTAPKESR